MFSPPVMSVTYRATPSARNSRRIVILCAAVRSTSPSFAEDEHGCHPIRYLYASAQHPRHGVVVKYRTLVAYRHTRLRHVPKGTTAVHGVVDILQVGARKLLPFLRELSIGPRGIC